MHVNNDTEQPTEKNDQSAIWNIWFKTFTQCISIIIYIRLFGEISSKRFIKRNLLAIRNLRCIKGNRVYVNKTHLRKLHYFHLREFIVHFMVIDIDIIMYNDCIIHVGTRTFGRIRGCCTGSLLLLPSDKFSSMGRSSIKSFPVTTPDCLFSCDKTKMTIGWRKNSVCAVRPFGRCAAETQMWNGAAGTEC